MLTICQPLVNPADNLSIILRILQIRQQRRVNIRNIRRGRIRNRDFCLLGLYLHRACCNLHIAKAFPDGFFDSSL